MLFFVKKKTNKQKKLSILKTSAITSQTENGEKDTGVPIIISLIIKKLRFPHKCIHHNENDKMLLYFVIQSLYKKIFLILKNYAKLKCLN